MPPTIRNTAYLWNPATASTYPNVPQGLTPTGSCAGVSATMVLLPGWYKNATLLNSYTTSAACNGGDLLVRTRRRRPTTPS